MLDEDGRTPAAPAPTRGRRTATGPDLEGADGRSEFSPTRVVTGYP